MQMQNKDTLSVLTPTNILVQCASQVLGGVVDKAIPLDDSTIPVIQDTLAILTSKEIKLTSLRRYTPLREEYTNISSEWFDCTEPSLTTAVVGNWKESAFALLIGVATL